MSGILTLVLTHSFIPSITMECLLGASWYCGAEDIIKKSGKVSVLMEHIRKNSKTIDKYTKKKQAYQRGIVAGNK